MSVASAQTMISSAMLAGLPASQQGQILQRAIQGNMAQLTHQAAAAHAQQLAMAAAQQAMSSNSAFFQGIPVTTSTSVPAGSMFITNVGSASTGTTTAATYTSARNLAVMNASDYYDYCGAQGDGRLRWPDGQAGTIELPDGTIIEIKADGSFAIEDKASKVIYRASRMRDFNPFINVSDRLEEFIAYCGAQHVWQGEMLELPLKLFVGWLVLQAALHDKEPEPQLALIPDLRKRASPKCPGCGRFVRRDLRAKQIEFCAPVCFDRHFARHVPLLQAAE